MQILAQAALVQFFSNSCSEKEDPILCSLGSISLVYIHGYCLIQLIFTFLFHCAYVNRSFHAQSPALRKPDLCRGTLALPQSSVISPLPSRVPLHHSCQQVSHWLLAHLSEGLIRQTLFVTSRLLSQKLDFPSWGHKEVRPFQGIKEEKKSPVNVCLLGTISTTKMDNIRDSSPATRYSEGFCAVFIEIELAGNF